MLPSILTPDVVLHVLLWAGLICTALVIFSDGHLRTLLWRHWPYLIAGLALTLAFRLPLGSSFFWGLEYEDSYVYTVAARQILDRPQSFVPLNWSPFLITLCSTGSFEECLSWETFSGHYIGYPFVMAQLAGLIGYSPHLGQILSLSAAGLSIIWIFLISHLVTEKFLASLASVVIFAATPAFAVHGVVSSAEPVSNAVISAAVVIHWRFWMTADRGDRKVPNALAWVALTASMMLAVVIKRENMLLPIALPLSALLTIGGPSGLKPRLLKLASLFASSILAVAFGLIALGLGNTVTSETSEYERLPFGIDLAWSMLPTFVHSYWVWPWFVGTAVFAVVGIVAAFRSRTNGLLFILCLWAAYLLLYSSHVRSYYQLYNNEISLEETLRYSMNTMSLWAILAGSGLAAVMERLRSCSAASWPVWKKGSIAAAFVALILALLLTARLRSYVVAEEWRERIAPALAAISAASTQPNSSYIITIEPLIIQMMGSRNISVIGLADVERLHLNDLVARSTLLYLEHKSMQNSIDHQRYAVWFAAVTSFQRDLLSEGDNYKLFRLKQKTQDGT